MLKDVHTVLLKHGTIDEAFPCLVDFLEDVDGDLLRSWVGHRWGRQLLRVSLGG